MTTNNKERVLRVDEVVERTGLSQPTIRRREIAGDFPSRRKLGPQAVGWLESEVNEWLQNRAKVHAQE